MDVIAREALREIRAEGSLADAAGRLKAMFERLAAEKIARLLVDLSGPEAQLDRYVLGYLVFGVLRHRVAADYALARELAKMIGGRVPLMYKLLTLDLLDRVARERGGQIRRLHRELVRRTSLAASQMHAVRELAARMLPRDADGEIRHTLLELIATGKRRLVDGASRSIARWGRTRLRSDAEIMGRLTDYALRSPAATVRSPNLLRVLARAATSRATLALREAGRRAEEPADWSRMVAIVAPLSTGDLRAEIIARAARVRAPIVRAALRSLFSARPSLLDELYSTGHTVAYLEAISLAPVAAAPNAAGRLARLMGGADRALARRAARVGRELGLNRRMRRFARFVAAGASGARRPPGMTALSSRTMGVAIAGGFSTGMNAADALYRDLLISVITANHWHVGMYLGFSVLGTDGIMQGIEVSKWPGDGVRAFQAKRSLADPAGDLVAKMTELRAQFLSEFDVGGRIAFHGGRSAAAARMTRQSRRSIADLAASMYGLGIWWSFANMLDARWSGWTGDLLGIENLRCDGLVEFCYETNNIRVCNGTKASLWNISLGSRHADNHNDMHNFALDAGELCPRIQAGDLGSATSFVSPAPTRPSVRSFSVGLEPVARSSSIKDVPTIRFEVESLEYETVYARLLVRRPGGSFDFVVTREGAMRPAGLAGRWSWTEVAQGVTHEALWAGETHAGLSYFGTNGDYELRLVAVDGGGNVSDMYACTLRIDWTQVMRLPW